MEELFSIGGRKAAWVIAALVLVANGFVAALVAISLHGSFKQYEDRAAITSRNTNRLVSQGVAAQIDQVDLGLLAIGDEYAKLHAARQVRKQEVTEMLRRHQARLPMTDGVRITDAGGRILFGTDAELPANVSIADRDYFKQLQADPGRGIVISPPLLGKISGKWILIHGRALRGKGGEFLGVAIASVTIEWFEKKFAELEVGPHGAVVLRGDATRNFDLLGRYPAAGHVGQTKVSDQFRATITANPHSGTYQAYAGADNIRRTFSYQAVGKYPLITLVGISTDDNLGPWWREVWLLCVLAGAFAVLSVVGGRSLVRAWNARAEAYVRVSALNAELEIDIAARRKAEAEVAALNAELEQRVRERTAELEAANKDLESFSYSASHDLRAPLRAIAGYSQILIEDEHERLSAEGQAMLDRVIHNTDRMGVLIDDILDYSRAGRRPLAAIDLDMTQLARDVSERLAAVYPAARIDIRPLPPAEGDRTMLEQVFQNLIGNALKYSAKKEQPEVVVGAEIQGGQSVYFVADNGAGFDMRYVDGMFGMFHRMHKESDFPGTGIGLAIVKRLVERHGGTVWAHAEPDRGATFYFTLGPAAAGDQAAENDVAWAAS